MKVAGIEIQSTLQDTSRIQAEYSRIQMYPRRRYRIQARYKRNTVPACILHVFLTYPSLLPKDTCLQAVSSMDFACIPQAARRYILWTCILNVSCMYPACILHVSDTLFQDTHASLYPARILIVSRMYLSRYDRIHHGSMYSPCIPRVQPVGIRTSGCILLYPIVSWCIPEAHGPGHVWGGGYVYRSVFCVYPNVFHPLLNPGLRYM